MRTASAERRSSRGALELPPPPPMPERTASRSPVERGSLAGGSGGGGAQVVQSVPWADSVTLRSLLPTLSAPSTVGSQPVPPRPGLPDAAGAVPSLALTPATRSVGSVNHSPTSATSSASSALVVSATASPSAVASPAVNVRPPAEAEALADGSRLFHMPSQVMRYTQRLDGSWKQWGPLPAPDDAADDVALALDIVRQELKDSEACSVQLQAALGKAARQGQVQCEQFEWRLGEMEADMSRSASLGAGEHASREIDRLGSRLAQLQAEAADLRTEVKVARTTCERSRKAAQAAKLARARDRKQVEALEAAGSKSTKQLESAQARMYNRAEGAAAAQSKAQAKARAVAEECLKLKDRMLQLEANLVQAKQEASGFRSKLVRCESTLQSALRREKELKKGGEESAAWIEQGEVGT